MKTWMMAIAACVLLSVMGAVQVKAAAADAAAKKDKPVRGQVVSVAADGASVTIMTTGKKAMEMTVTTDASTKVTIDGADAKLADLKKDLYVTVTPATGTATSIKATTAKPEKKPKA